MLQRNFGGEIRFQSVSLGNMPDSEDGLGEVYREAENQPEDEWGANGPNQVIDEAEQKIAAKNAMWRNNTFSGAYRRLGQVRFE